MIDYRTDQKTEIWFDLEDDLTPFLEDNPKYVTRGINSSRKSIVAYLKLVDETFFTTDHFTILEFIQESKKPTSIKSLMKAFSHVKDVDSIIDELEEAYYISKHAYHYYRPYTKYDNLRRLFKESQNSTL